MNATDFWINTNKLIKTRNTTQEWVASQCDIPLGTFRNSVSKDRIPDAIRAYKIAQALNTSVEFLLTGEQPEPSEIKIAELKDKLENVKDKLQNIIDEDF